MKRIILLALLAISTLSICAQEKYDPRKNGNIILKVIHPGMNIQDKIIVENCSPYLIEQVVVCAVENNELRPLGTCTDIDPGDDCCLVYYAKNSLKQLKGKYIAIKAKAIKNFPGSESRTKVKTPIGKVEVDVQHQKFEEGESKEPDPDNITYEFKVELAESRHDLLVKLFSAQGQNVMDF